MESADVDIRLWTPPSLKAMDALPSIEIIGEDGNQKFLDWFEANPTIARTVPPMWMEFTIKYNRTYKERSRTALESINLLGGIPPAPADAEPLLLDRKGV